MPRHAVVSRLARIVIASIAGLVVAAMMAAVPQAAGAAPAPAVAIGAPVGLGNAPTLGSMAGKAMPAPVVSMAANPDGVGYWLVASNGGVFTYGAARFYGSAGDIHLNSPIVGMAAVPGGTGYWLVAKDGGVFTYGAARFYGSAGDIHLNSPIIGMAAVPGGKGYWLVAADGGIFSYGTARYKGSTGATRLNSPIVGMAASPTGMGYWLVAADGGVFTYGSARFHGSAGGTHLNAPIVAMAPSAGGGGYWLAAANGGVFNYGSAPFEGALSGSSVADAKARVATIAATPDGGGYWLLPLALPPPPRGGVPPLVLPVLQEGDTGAAVLELQERLTALGYWLGTPNGVFGDSTQQAVYALQKAAGLSRDGVAGSATDQAIAEGIVPHPLSTGGYVIEVDLAVDLLMFVDNGKLLWTLNTSTGGGYTYYNGSGGYDVATTPTGVFNIYYTVNGSVTDYLGTLWRPRYFYSGFAIHGDGYVPPYPVSHGCVRVSYEAIDWIWAENLAPIGTEVWVYN
jgi:peptidoglycan hydrolase-like protein with peptidoglycan-binding domain